MKWIDTNEWLEGRRRESLAGAGDNSLCKLAKEQPFRREGKEPQYGPYDPGSQELEKTKGSGLPVASQEP